MNDPGRVLVAAGDRPLAIVASIPGAAGTGPAGGAGRRPRQTRPLPAAPGGASSPGPSTGLTEAHLDRLALAFATLYLEVEAGRRPRSQVERLMTRALAAQVAGRWVRPGPEAVVTGVSGCRTAADRYDAVAIVRRGARYGALALGLQRSGTRWMVISAVRPEDGPLPPPPVYPPDEPEDGIDDQVDWHRIRRELVPRVC